MPENHLGGQSSITHYRKTQKTMHCKSSAAGQVLTQTRKGKLKGTGEIKHEVKVDIVGYQSGQFWPRRQRRKTTDKPVLPYLYPIPN